MAVIDQKIKTFISGVHNLLPDEVIPQDAASDELNWQYIDGHIELSRGRQAIGGTGAVGKNYGEHVAYRLDRTAVRFRKVSSKIQYLNGSTWTDVITGLTVDADYTFSNYISLAGSFVYCFGIDGIYKIATANPATYTALYDPAKNHKGFGFIDKSATFMWAIPNDPTSLYRSYIDALNYTTVSAEAIGSLGSTLYTGTLAFKAGGPTRTAFAVTFTALTASGQETFTDDRNGVLTSNFGGTGTIDYTTGDYSITFANVTTGAVTSDYQWEDSNDEGVTDFTQSGTRLAGEGLVIPQSIGGDRIVTVIPLDGSYFSLKEFSAYQLTIDADDLGYTNGVFRTDIGVPSLRAAVGTGQGIIFMNTANPSRPTLNRLSRNPLGDNFDVKPLFAQFAFENYVFDDCLVDTWDRYVIIGCKDDSIENNRLLLCDVPSKLVDITYYGIRTSCKLLGLLYGGDPVSQTTYEILTGFDDVGVKITNYWESKGETYGSDVLKRVKRMRFKGKIDPQQAIEVYLSTEDGGYQLVGTILGTGSYVDYTTTYAIGTNIIGENNIGGGNVVSVYGYLMEIKLRIGKFRKRKVKLVATGFGYASVEQITDFDIWTYQEKLPPQYRSKQNVALAGAPTDLPNPQ